MLLISTSTGYLRCSIGGCNGTYGTFAAVIRFPTSFLGINPIIELCNSGFTQTYYSFGISTTAKLTLRNSGGTINASTSGLTSGGYYIVVVTKDTGTVAPRYHFLRLDSTNPTWTHENAALNLADSGFAGGAIQFFRQASTSVTSTTIQIQAAAYWKDRALTDTEVESLEGFLTRWHSLSPTGFWILDQESAQTVDLTGNGANYSAISGSTTRTTSAPMAEIGGLSLMRRGGISAGTAITKVINDTVEIGEAIVRKVGLTRVLTESVEIAESVIRNVGITRVLTESVEIAESVVRKVGLTRVQTDSVEIGESFPKFLGIIRVQTDSVEVADDNLRFLGIVRVQSDGVEVGESFPYGRGLTRVQTDSVEIGESFPLTQALIRIITDTVEVAESVVRNVAILRVQSDSVEIGDSALRFLGLVRVQTDSVEVGEDFPKFLGIVRVQTDDVEIGESVNGTLVDIYAGLLHIAYQYFRFIPNRLRATRRVPIDNDDDPSNDSDP